MQPQPPTSPAAADPADAWDLSEPMVLAGVAVPEPLPAAAVERATRLALLPTASPRLVTRLQPPRAASRFDADATLALALQDPAVLLALYEEARSPEGGTLTPRALVEKLGASGVATVVRRLQTRPTLAVPDADPWLRRGYRHALAVARLAAELAPRVKADPVMAAAAGLIHDAGRLVLLAGELRDRVQEVFSFAQLSPLDTSQIERLVLGKSHRQLGGDACAKLPMPPALFAACRAHDHSEAQLERLDGGSRALVALVAACDRYAKTAGFGGCPSEELRPVAPQLAPVLDAAAGDLKRVLGEVEAAVEAWWAGPAPVAAADRPLAGLRVSYATPRAGAWTPFEGVLRQAGAAVARLPWEHAALLAGREAHALVIDCAGLPLAPVLPQVARVLAAPRQGGALLLAERVFEPDDRLREAALGALVYATPIRAANLVRVVEAMATGARAAA